MIEWKSPAEVDAIGEAGTVVATVLRDARAHARAGTRPRELDEVAGTVLAAAGAKPSFPQETGRRFRTPYPARLCCSVNDVVTGGVPGETALAVGDLVSLHCGVRVDGWHAEAAVTFAVGVAGDDDQRLLTTVHDALDDGVAAAVSGARVGDVSHAMGVVARSAGCGLPTHLGGHGIGRDRTQEPFVPLEGAPETGTPLRPGMVVTIEALALAGGDDDVRGGDDAWAVHTGDGSRAAHVAHTVAVTSRGPVILTVL